MPIETFVDPAHGLDRQARSDMKYEELREELFEPDKPQSFGEWLRVHYAKRRGKLFVIEAERLEYHATLRFCPEHPDIGDYEIHYDQPPGPVEKGRTVKVTEVTGDETNRRLSILKPFAVRYAIRTAANGRPRHVLVWRVGLNGYRPVDEKEETDNDAA
jgi:hypothetical protein